MIDIEKMKAEFAEKIRCAEAENRIEAELNDPELEVSYGASWKKGGLDRISIRSKESHDWRHRLTYQQAGRVLQAFPVSETSEVDCGNRFGKRSLLYRMSVDRNPNDPRTTLSIDYISGDYEISLYVDLIDNNDEWLGDVFTRTTRELTDSEISSYGIQKNRSTYNWRHAFQFLSWGNGEVVRYQGGSHKQCAPWVLDMVAQRLIDCANYTEAQTQGE